MTQQDEWMDVKAMASEIDADIRVLPNRNAGNVRAVRRRYSRQLTKASPQQIIALARCLIDKHGHRSVAYELIHYHRTALASLRAEELEALGHGMASWGAVDNFACLLAGPAWRENQVPDELVHEWAHSEDRWWRRAALVSTVALNVKARGGSGDAPRTLQVCRLLVNDQDDMVVKALSWALRELVRHDLQAVLEFLAEHEDVLAARVKREVRNKLTTGLKNPRRK